MAISLDSGFGLEAFNTANSQAANKNSADKIAGQIKGVGADSTEEELTAAVKSFESYFVEQMLKEFKETESFFSGGDDSSSTSYTDIFLDSTISDLASQIVDEYGGSLTEQFVEQMKINYGIGQNTPASAEAPATDNAPADSNTESI